jgi:hypothetical protein
MRLAAFRRALLPAVVAAAALVGGAPTAGAQSISSAYAPGCGPGTVCALLRFNFANTSSSAMLFNSLSLTSATGPLRFAPAAGGVALYQAVDAIGPFGGTGTVTPGGTQLFIDFIGGNGFQFELGPGTSGYVEVPLAQVSALVDRGVTFSAALQGGRTFTGTVAVLPEPATFALVGGGLALVGIATRRRRRA